MATQLIPVFNGTISNEPVLLCDARELHNFLEVGKRFASWITERIGQYGFLSNQDYIAISQNREIGHGRGKIDYHLTLDTAKELAMVERNDKGRQVRRYFIECERKLYQQSLPAPINEDASPVKEKLPAGVYFQGGKYNPYRASATIDGKYIHIGVYPTVEDAVIARMEYLRKHHVESVVRNNPDLVPLAHVRTRLLIEFEGTHAESTRILHPDAITATPDNLPDVLREYGWGRISIEQHQRIIEACVEVIARKCKVSVK